MAIFKEVVKNRIGDLSGEVEYPVCGKSYDIE